MQEVGTEPVRLKHNRELATQFITAEWEGDRYPSISRQIDLIPIEGLPHAYPYNPTLIRQPGNGLLLAYRYHTDTSQTKLHLATIAETGQVESHRPLTIDGGPSLEDPHLFRLNDKTMVSWVESRFPKQMLAIVKYSELDSPGPAIQPTYGKNDWTAVEKNWVFFEHSNLCCKYQTSPEQIIFDELGNVWRTPGPQWPYGPPRGGTCPVMFGGFLLWFFHSTLWNEFSNDRWRYYLGAYITQAKPPFEVVNVLKKPLLYGSSDDDLTPKKRSECFHWKGKVVFCSGCVEHPDYYLLSLGINDSACALVKIDRRSLRL